MPIKWKQWLYTYQTKNLPYQLRILAQTFKHECTNGFINQMNEDAYAAINQIVKDATKQIHAFSNKDSSLFIHALFYIQKHYKYDHNLRWVHANTLQNFITKWFEVTIPKLDTFDQKCLSISMSALAYVNNFNNEFINKFILVAQKKLQTFTSKSIANILWSFGKFNIQNPLIKQLIDIFLTKKCSAIDVSMVVWALAKLNIPRTQIPFQQLKNIIIPKIKQFDEIGLNTMVYSLDTLKYKDSQLAILLSGQLKQYNADYRNIKTISKLNEIRHSIHVNMPNIITFDQNTNTKSSSNALVLLNKKNNQHVIPKQPLQFSDKNDLNVNIEDNLPFNRPPQNEKKNPFALMVEKVYTSKNGQLQLTLHASTRYYPKYFDNIFPTFSELFKYIDDCVELALNYILEPIEKLLPRFEYLIPQSRLEKIIQFAKKNNIKINIDHSKQPNFDQIRRNILREIHPDKNKNLFKKYNELSQEFNDFVDKVTKENQKKPFFLLQDKFLDPALSSTQCIIAATDLLELSKAYVNNKVTGMHIKSFLKNGGFCVSMSLQSNIMSYSVGTGAMLYEAYQKDTVAATKAVFTMISIKLMLGMALPYLPVTTTLIKTGTFLYNAYYIASYIAHNIPSTSNQNQDLTNLLYDACKNGNVETLKLILKYDVSLNNTYENGLTPLLIAVQNNNLQVAKLLLDQNVSSEQVGKQGKPPLYFALINNNYNMIKLLLEYNADPNKNVIIESIQYKNLVIKTNDEKIPLLLLTYSQKFMYHENRLFLSTAQQIKKYKITKLLLNFGANLHQTSSPHYNFSFTYIAAMIGAYKIIRLLIKRNANIDDGNNVTMTPLCISAKFGHTKSVQKLLPHVNPMKSCIPYGSNTALDIAKSYKHHRIVSIINNKVNKQKFLAPLVGCDIYENTETLLYNACAEGNVKIVKMLLRHNININSMHENNYSYLLIAVKHNHFNITKLLLQSIADPNQLGGKIDDSPLYFAVENNNYEMTKLLLQYGADSNYQRSKQFLTTQDTLSPEPDTGGETIPILTLTLSKKEYAIAELLLQFEAKPNQPTTPHLHITPIYIATISNDPETINLLIKFNANINEYTVNNMTPLCIAAYMGFMNAAKALLPHADLAKTCLQQYTALYLAQQNGYDDIAAMIEVENENRDIALSGISDDHMHDNVEGA